MTKADTNLRMYVYILRSKSNKNKIYTGITSNLERRLEEHNSGKLEYTSEFRPWVIETYISFNNEKLAYKFERYLKSGSGRSFLRKRLIS